MKRDMDLVRLLLLSKEGEEKVSFEKYSKDQINYHLGLLVHEGYLLGNVRYSSKKHSDIPEIVFVESMTWKGHEFLDMARDDTV